MSTPPLSSRPNPRPARLAHQVVVDRAGDQENDLHAAPGGLQERADHLPVRHEVGVRDVNGLAGRGHRKEEHRVHRRAAASRRAADDLRVDVALGVEATARKVHRAADRHAARLEPVLGERALELLDHRPFDADVGVAPVPGLLAVPAPFPTDPGAAGHAHHAVDDENPVVVSVVDPIHREGAQGPKDLDATPRLGHRGAQLGRHGERADGVQEHVDLNARAAALRERGRDFLRWLAVLEDVLRIVR
jgi:hypothetical protein